MFTSVPQRKYIVNVTFPNCRFTTLWLTICVSMSVIKMFALKSNIHFCAHDSIKDLEVVPLNWKEFSLRMSVSSPLRPGMGWEWEGCCCKNYRIPCELFEARSIYRLDKKFLSLDRQNNTEYTYYRPSNFSRFSVAFAFNCKSRSRVSLTCEKTSLES